jgi:hypothetical protein
MSLDSMKAPMPDDQIRQMGFDGWAKNFLTGPEPVIAMLCSEKLLHSTPISLREIPEEAFNELQNGSLSSWVSGQNSFQVTRRREYGPSATSTRVRQLKRAQVWTSQPVDVSLRRQHQANIDLWREQLKEINDKLQSEKATMEKLRQDLDRNDQETVLTLSPVFNSLADGSHRTKSRGKRSQNRRPILNIEPFPRRLVCTTLFHGHSAG